MGRDGSHHAPALARPEAVVDRSGVAERIEALLPVGVRPRQLSVRTLLIGMLLVASEGRAGSLRNLHRALTALPEAERRRLGVIAGWRYGPHALSYRQVERTFALVTAALGKGQVILFAFRPQHRGQTHAAFPLLFNALLDAAAR